MRKNKKIFIIINPVSGKVSLRQKLWQILDVFSAAGMQTLVAFTQKRGDATELARKCSKNIETIVCAGGDGTLNEVICGLMSNPHPHKLGYIPVGTTNDLANSLGISKNPVQAAKDIIEGESQPLDIGSFAGRYFNYIASFGVFTEASYSTPQSAKNLLGHFAYVLEGVKSLTHIRPYKVRFEFDDKTIDDEFIFAAISNTTSMGGIIKLKDNLVALNDGKLEVLLIHKPKNIAQLQRIVSQVLTQNFTNDLVEFHHTAKIKVTTEEEINWTLDGEMEKGDFDFEITNVHSAINLIIPSKPAKNKLIDENINTQQKLQEEE